MPITVLNPTNRSEASPLRMARPLETLEGALVGVLDNSKVNAEVIFQHVERGLIERYGVREVIWRRKHDFSRPAPAALLAELSACDAVITGIGDWGSCSSCSVHDAISAEKLGIPAVGVMTQRFLPTARTMADFLGFADYPVASIDHPISNNTVEELHQKADEVLEQSVALLLHQPARRQ